MSHDDETVERAHATEQPASTGSLQAGETVGRYVVLRHLGSGGSGQVYAAMDQLLKRQVALKVLHVASPDPGASSPAVLAQWDGLLHEAQAMARLSHPNVVTVHDVAIEGERVLLSMELIDGVDLATWLEDPDHADAKAVVRTLVAAGRGLEAAHCAKIVHRDFKPANVLVTSEGIPKVADFGLSAWRRVDEVSPSGDDELDRTRAPFGTPAYMPPEQHEGEPGDERADIYAFGVTLLEALWRSRPFRAPDLDGLAALKRGGMPPAPADARSLPRDLEALIRRTLDPDPDGRPSSIGAVLGELDRWIAPRGRAGWIVAAVASGLAVTAGAVWGQSSESEAARCEDGPDRAASAYGPEQRAALERGFAALDEPWAPIAARIATRELGAYAEQWAAMYADACRARWIEGTQSDDLFDRRMACLGDRLAALTRIVAILTEPDEPLARRSSDEIAALPSISSCGDLDTLRRRVELPNDPTTRAALRLLTKQLAEVRDLKARGHYPDALEAARKAANRARGMSYKPGEAEALYLLSVMQTNTGDDEGAEASMHEAVAAAQAGRHDRVEADAWIYLVHLVGKARRHQEALRYARFAEAALERLGVNDEAAARLAVSRGSVLASMGDSLAALADYRAAAELETELYGAESAQGLLTLHRIAHAETQLRRYDAALATFDRGLATAERELGPDHPTTAMFHNSVASIKAQLRDFEGAVPHFQAALDIRRRVLAPDDPDLAASYKAFGVFYINWKKYEPARKHLLASRDVMVARYGEDHPNLTPLHNELCSVSFYLEAMDEADEHCTKARKIAEAQPNPDPQQYHTSLTRLAILAKKRGSLKEALAWRLRGLEVAERAWGVGHSKLAESMLGAASLLIKLEQHDEARIYLERGLTLRTTDGDAHRHMAFNLFLMAKALDGRQRGRAIEYAQRAWQEGKRTGDDLVVEDAAKWLRKRAAAVPEQD